MFEDNPRLKGKGPNCDGCFPGVHVSNMDAWEVFQRYASPMGIDSGIILSLCNAYEVEDPTETLEKVLFLLGEIEKDG